MIRAARTPGPFIVHCTRDGCDQTREVTSAWKQQRQRFCSHRCANLRHRLNHGDRLTGAARSKQRRSARAIERLRGLTPLEIFRRAYKTGWQQGRRSIARQRAAVPMVASSAQASFAAEVIEAFLRRGICPAGYDRADLGAFARALKDAAA